jgi:DNA-directed RNA polymerase subunit RPC12/RpoP
VKDRYVVGECPRCHSLIIADTRYRSKSCPNCSARLALEDLRVVRTARDSREARAILSNAKAVRGGLNQT